MSKVFLKGVTFELISIGREGEREDFPGQRGTAYTKALGLTIIYCVCRWATAVGESRGDNGTRRGWGRRQKPSVPSQRVGHKNQNLLYMSFDLCSLQKK